MADEDPDRIIYAWCNSFKVPTWQAKGATKTCKQCNERFKSGHEHNCRLCGTLYCSSCTIKAHLPEIYNLKKKKGASRVCVGCRDVCLAEKKKAQETPNSASDRKGASQSTTPSVIYPPAQWADINRYLSCSKCVKKGGKAHNCRVCGLLYCNSCTQKMDVPACFEKKSHKASKPGPVRVCDVCRFKLLGGAKLSQTGSPEGDEKLNASAGGSIATSGAPSPRPSTFAPPPVPSAGLRSGEHKGDENAASSQVAITFKAEGETKQLCRITVKQGADLKSIDIKFTRECPQSEAFSYLCRGEVVHRVFWDIFTTEHLGPSVTIRREGKETFVMPLAPIASLADGPNPYRMDVNKKPAKEVAKVKVQEVKKVFKKPKKEKKFAPPSLETKTRPPPPLPTPTDGDVPPGFVASTRKQRTVSAATDVKSKEASEMALKNTAAGGGSVEDVFKQRAKLVFGAK